MKITSLTTALTATLLLTGAASAAFNLQGGIGTFTTQGQSSTFQLLSSGYAASLTQITVTLGSSASESGAEIRNTGLVAGNFSRTLSSTFSATLLGAITGGTVNLSAADTKSLAPNVPTLFSVSDSDSNVLIINPLFHSLFIGTFDISGLSAATGTIAASTLTSTPSVFGANGSGSFNVNAVDATSIRSNSWKIEYTVPEPSSAVLGAIGSLMLLRRRRN